MQEENLSIGDADEMERLGEAIGGSHTDLSNIHLHGPLAAGKTTLARGLIHSLGHRGAVKSPTFTLVESYQLTHRAVHHFDLYRISDPDELEFIGIDEYQESDALCLFEWAELGAQVLVAPDLDIDLRISEAGRDVVMRSPSDTVLTSILDSFNSKKQ